MLPAIIGFGNAIAWTAAMDGVTARAVMGALASGSVCIAIAHLARP